MSIDAMLLLPAVVLPLPVPDAERVELLLLRELFALLPVAELDFLSPLDRPVVDGLLVPAFLVAIGNLLSKKSLR